MAVVVSVSVPDELNAKWKELRLKDKSITNISDSFRNTMARW